MIAAVPFSENLGDQVIAECLEHLIRRANPSADVVPVDFSGRLSRNERSAFRKEWATRVFFATPKPLRAGLVAASLYPYLLLKQRSRWRILIRYADVILVGGGQLVQDVHLNFPVKLSVFSRLVGAEGKRFSLIAVGVDPRTSSLGRKLLRQALAPHRVLHAWCRDAGSVDAIKQIVGDGLPSSLAPDPALWADEVYRQSHSGEGFVGINLASPHELASSVRSGSEFTVPRLTEMWRSTIAGLISAGNRVLVFTNGSAIDEEFAQHVLEALPPSHTAQCTRAPRPHSAAALVSTIARCGVVVAHRMHACILAVSLGLGVVPLLWDKKVEGFFSLLGRPDACVRPHEATSSRIVAEVASGGVRVAQYDVKRVRALTDVAIRAALGLPADA